MASPTDDDIAKALRSNTAALSAFEALPPSHRNEYLGWIGEAKREGTRQRRITGMIDKLSEAKSRNGQA